MGWQKEELDRLDGLYAYGQTIAGQVGAIKECENHPGIFMSRDDADAEKMAYAVAINKIKTGKFPVSVKS